MNDKVKPSLYREWEYRRSGDYHRNLDPNWSYTPTYLRKRAFVRSILETLPKDARILDAGCGEGVLVEEFSARGWDIQGLDLNYESASVKRGDVRNLPYPDNSFDAALLLDVLEHLPFDAQAKALSELYRVLKFNGCFVLSTPNLAHLNSRVKFLLKGCFDRTDIEENHPGERPVAEYRKLLEDQGFQISKSTGITFTIPILYRKIICRHPARMRWLHDLMEPLARLFPSLAMVNVFVCGKRPQISAAGKVGLLTKLDIIRKSRVPCIFSIPTHVTQRERVTLFELCRTFKTAPTVVEIGSYLGASASFLAAGVRSSGGKVYAVDTWTNIGMSEGARETYPDFLRNIRPLNQWIIPLKGLSVDISRDFTEKIDLLFIDGEHTYESVKADVDVWLPKVREDGIVAFHDYGWAEGVQKAVREKIVPKQTGVGHMADSIYWARISQVRIEEKDTGIIASVIVPTYGRPEMLKDCLLSLTQQNLPAERYEIIVVDNKPDGTIKNMLDDLFSERRPRIRYIEEANPGLHNARHAGAKAAAGKILVYVDDDVIVHPDWLLAINGPFENEKVGMVCGSVFPKWKAALPDWFSDGYNAHLSLLDLGSETRELKWPEGVYGCNMAIRKSIIYETGGFNPDAFGDHRLIWLRGDGETGLNRKVVDIGYKVIYEPGAWLYHQIPAVRIQPSYLYWRSFIQGISDSYTRSRRRPLFFRFFAGGFLSVVKCSLRSFWNILKSFRQPQNVRIRRMIKVFYWRGYGMHQLRVLFNRRLRKHVLRDNYF